MTVLYSTYMKLHAERKTTVMKKACGEDVHEISPTVGFNIQTLAYNGYTLNLWDVGVQKSIRTYWRNYFEQTDGTYR